MLQLFKDNVTDMIVLNVIIRYSDHPGISYRLGLLLVPKIIPEHSQDRPQYSFGLTTMSLYCPKNQGDTI